MTSVSIAETVRTGVPGPKSPLMKLTFSRSIATRTAWRRIAIGTLTLGNPSGEDAAAFERRRATVRSRRRSVKTMKIWPLALSAVALLSVQTTLAGAEDVSTKKLLIKDNANVAKRKIILLSKDAGVAFAEADDPGANGAVVHLYSATDDYCAILPAGSDWQNTGTIWKYKSAVTKNVAQIKDGKLFVKLGSGVGYSLADDGSQGTVNVQVQFGTAGTRYCLRCPGNKKDDAAKFLGKDCAAAACDAEPSGACDPSPPGVELQGALTATPGRFNYNLTLGLPGADAACNTNFAGTHACTYTELLAAEAAGDLVGLKDIGNNTVTSFWVIDTSNNADINQCNDDAVTPGVPVANRNWEYGTAHTPSRGQRVDLNNPAGTLGAVQAPQQCNFSSRWVGCCL